MSEQSIEAVKIGFETQTRRIPIDDIQLLRTPSVDISKSMKYKQIRSSLRELGSIEPPVVAEDRQCKGKYLLLDGHMRVQAMRELGSTEITCIVSTDDEGFTYNKRVNRLATVQQHRMLTRAIKRGVSEERIAKALNVTPYASVNREDFSMGSALRWQRF